MTMFTLIALVPAMLALVAVLCTLMAMPLVWAHAEAPMVAEEYAPWEDVLHDVNAPSPEPVRVVWTPRPKAARRSDTRTILDLVAHEGVWTLPVPSRMRPERPGGSVCV